MNHSNNVLSIMWVMTIFILQELAGSAIQVPQKHDPNSQSLLLALLVSLKSKLKLEKHSGLGPSLSEQPVLYLKFQCKN